MKPSADTRQIYITPETLTSRKNTNKKVRPPPPPPKKRLATESKRWDFEAEVMTPEYQLGLLSKCFVEQHAESSSESQAESSSESQAESPDSRVRLLEQQIHYKWYGYRCQDNEKGLFAPETFVSEKEIAELLSDSRLLCFYCRCPIQLFYEYVRESTQWSLERIDNAYGHNRGNVEIACLGCNVRRRTMYYERFLATKQMTITKQNNSR